MLTSITLPSPFVVEIEQIIVVINATVTISYMILIPLFEPKIDCGANP